MTQNKTLLVRVSAVIVLLFVLAVFFSTVCEATPKACVEPIGSDSDSQPSAESHTNTLSTGDEHSVLTASSTVISNVAVNLRLRDMFGKDSDNRAKARENREIVNRVKSNVLRQYNSTIEKSDVVLNAVLRAYSKLQQSRTATFELKEYISDAIQHAKMLRQFDRIRLRFKDMNPEALLLFSKTGGLQLEKAIFAVLNQWQKIVIKDTESLYNGCNTVRVFSKEQRDDCRTTLAERLTVIRNNCTNYIKPNKKYNPKMIDFVEAFCVVRFLLAERRTILTHILDARTRNKIKQKYPNAIIQSDIEYAQVLQHWKAIVKEINVQAEQLKESKQLSSPDVERLKRITMYLASAMLDKVTMVLSKTIQSLLDSSSNVKLNSRIRYRSRSAESVTVQETCQICQFDCLAKIKKFTCVNCEYRYFNYGCQTLNPCFRTVNATQPAINAGLQICMAFNKCECKGPNGKLKLQSFSDY